MTPTQFLKRDLKPLRDEMARGYRILRKSDPEKARELRRRMKASIAILDADIIANMVKGPETVQ